MQYPVFAPNILFLLQALQKWQLDFSVPLLSLVQNLPQLGIHAIIFIFYLVLYTCTLTKCNNTLLWKFFKMHCILLSSVNKTGPNRTDSSDARPNTPSSSSLPLCCDIQLSDDTTHGCQPPSSVRMEEGIGYGSPTVYSE